MSVTKDTYFLSPDRALQTAKQKNQFLINDIAKSTQICYYHGDEIPDAPYNCINVPIKEMINYFSTTQNRYPTTVDIEDSDMIREDEFEIFNKQITKILSIAKNNQNKRVFELKEIIKKLKPTFSKDEKLRVFIAACRHTSVMQYVSKTVANSFAKLGCDVLFHIEHLDIEDCYPTGYLQRHIEFNPHIVFNINHMANGYLHDEVFNFIWFQDTMPEIKDETEVKVRDKDFVFSLVPFFDNLLKKKNVPFERQSFCINTDIFNTNSNIKRENKVIFIGSSYFDGLQRANLRDDQILALQKMVYDGVDFNDEMITKTAAELNMDKHTFEVDVLTSSIRLFSVMALCELKLDIKIEIYGYGWETIESVKPFFKGKVEYGEELANVYRSAKYVLAPHSHYIKQQRVLEAAACGAIPVAYRCDSLDKSYNYPESILLYKNLKEMITCFSKEVPDLKKIVEDHTFDKFAKRMLDIVKGYNNNG